MIGFFIALISGALMSVQGVFNTQVTKNSSIWVASAFVQFTTGPVVYRAAGLSGGMADHGQEQSAGAP